MDRSYLIRLPWPPKALHAHAKGHWKPKATATKKVRRDAYVMALGAGVARYPEAELEFSYCPPDRRKRDVHNVHHAMKPVIDGIADAMKVDDNDFRCVFPSKFQDPTKGGCVLVHIRPGR